MFTLDEEMKIISRLVEIQRRVDELKDEAPLLTNALDNAIANGNKLEMMFCQITMASRLNESQMLLKEVDDIRETLGI